MKPREAKKLFLEVGNIWMRTTELIHALRLSALERLVIALENLGDIGHNRRDASLLSTTTILPSKPCSPTNKFRRFTSWRKAVRL